MYSSIVSKLKLYRINFTSLLFCVLGGIGLPEPTIRIWTKKERRPRVLCRKSKGSKKGAGCSAFRTGAPTSLRCIANPKNPLFTLFSEVKKANKIWNGDTVHPRPKPRVCPGEMPVKSGTSGYFWPPHFGGSKWHQQTILDVSCPDPTEIHWDPAIWSHRSHLWPEMPILWHFRAVYGHKIGIKGQMLMSPKWISTPPDPTDNLQPLVSLNKNF